MKLHILKYSVLGLLVSLSSVVYGASTDFTVRTLIGGDTTPPSIPAGLMAVPVATSQINLSWGTSTDDVMLSGYHVYRDNIQIATTTAANYSDIGLTPSTTYAYYITAFDSFMNISASSTVVATTTLPTTTTTPTTTPPTNSSNGPTYGSIVRLGEIVSLVIIPSQTGVVIRYETSGYVRSVVRWGTTISYELGSIAERSFARFHETVIDGLSPDTFYKFTIQGENNIGRFGTLTESLFRTLPLSDTLPPSNVTGLTAIRDGNDIVLTWENPLEKDFDHIRILRSDAFYPSDTADGWVVYEGDGRVVRDEGSALTAPRQYYTVFTYDSLGNISSGAVVSIQLTHGGGEPIDVVVPEVNPIDLNLDTVALYQDNVRIPFERGTALINGAKHLTISIPYSALPEHLKTILVTLTSPQDETKELNFLLRVNTEKTAYVAYLAPLGTAGDFPLRIAIFDFKTTQIGYTHGRITSEIISYEPPLITPDTSSLDKIIEFLRTTHLDYVLWFLLLLITLAFLARRLLHGGERESTKDRL